MLGGGAWVEIKYPKDIDAPLAVLMSFHHTFITHVGVFIGKNRIIHTMKHTGAVISRIDKLKPNIVGYYRPLKNWNPYRKREFWRRRHYGC